MDEVAAKPESMKKRRAAMKKRLATLGKNNPVVAEAIKNQEPYQEDVKWKAWRVVDELVSAARQKYLDKEGASMKECVANLASALSKLASKKGLSEEKTKDENYNSDD